MCLHLNSFVAGPPLATNPATLLQRIRPIAVGGPFETNPALPLQPCNESGPLPLATNPAPDSPQDGALSGSFCKEFGHVAALLQRIRPPPPPPFTVSSAILSVTDRPAAIQIKVFARGSWSVEGLWHLRHVGVRTCLKGFRV